MTRLTADFWESEFACSCCGQVMINPDSLARLQRLRSRYGKPLRIIEGGGYRCQHKLGDRYETSAHGGNGGTGAMGFDLGYPREDHFKLVRLAFEVGFTGIGDKNRDGRYQLHVDDAYPIPGARTRPWKWSY